MEKNVLSTLLIILTINCFAGSSSNVSVANTQGGFVINVTVSSLGTRSIKTGGATILDFSNFADYSAPGTFKLPVEELIIALPPNAKPEILFKELEKNIHNNTSPTLNPKVRLTPDSVFTTEEVPYSQMITKNIPQMEIGPYFWYRDFYCVKVKIKLASYDIAANRLEEITRYSLEVKIPGYSSGTPIKIKTSFDDVLKKTIANADIAEGFRSRAPLSTNNLPTDWIKFSGKYVKLGVAEDRIYRVTGKQLKALNVNIGAITPSTIQLFNRGKEMPVYISSKSSSAFDTSDYIEFYGTKNYNPISARVINTNFEPYNDYLNKYTDTSFYFLTWNNTTALNHPPVYVSPRPGPVDTIKYFTELIHYEKDNRYQGIWVVSDTLQFPLDQRSKTWYDQYLNAGTDCMICPTRALDDIMPGKTAALYVKAVSSALTKLPDTTAMHNIAVGLKTNSNSSDTNYFVVERRSAGVNERLLLGGQFPSDSVRKGINYIFLRLYSSLIPAVDVNQMITDWYELEVPRKLRATKDSLYFEIKDASQAGYRTIRIDSLTQSLTESSYLLYKVKPEFKKIENFEKIGRSIFFADSVTPGSAYYLLPSTGAKAVPYMAAKEFINLSSPRSIDYIAITHPTLYESSRKYVDFIKEQYKVNTLLVSVSDVYDEFNYGYPAAEAIKTMLQIIRSKWTVFPSDLCLIGSASYDYKNKYPLTNPRNPAVNFNLVPSMGEPLTDSWYTMLDTANELLQQMNVGRIPAKNSDIVDKYFAKHRLHVNQKYDVWNKTGLFFSGGDSQKSEEIQRCYNYNQAVADEYSNKPPLGLIPRHLYKTYYPFTNFGTSDFNLVNKIISDGAMFVSYIGHSSADLWDNSITNPDQLNNWRNKGSLITDFGCSTGKFGEPDIDCFGTKFINLGQAVGYIGNSSLGYASGWFPMLFYRYLLRDSVLQMSKAHALTKKEIVSTSYEGIYRLFAYTSVYFGDPIIRLAVTPAPNFKVSNETISLVSGNPNDKDSLAALKIQIENTGRVSDDSLDISVTARHSGSVTLWQKFRIKMPYYHDTLLVNLPILNKYGLHEVTVQVDSANKYTEMDESDNITVFPFNVVSLSIRPLFKSDYQAEAVPSFNLLSAVADIGTAKREAILQYDNNPGFTNPKYKTVPLDTFATSVSISGLSNGKYWLRARLNTTDTLWSKAYTFYQDSRNLQYLIVDSSIFAAQKTEKLGADKNGLRLVNDTVSYRVLSMRTNTYMAEIYRNGKELLNNSFGWGFGVAIVDPITQRVDTARTFYTGGVMVEFDSLTSLLNRLPNGKIVIMTVINDGRIVGTYTTDIHKTPALKNAIKACGASLIDGLGEQMPWVMIGAKGLASGKAREKMMRTSEPLTLDTSYIIINKQGYFTSPAFTNIDKWKELYLDSQLPDDSKLLVRPIITRLNGSIDTLGNLGLNSGRASLSFLDTMKFSAVNFLVEFVLSTNQTSPVLSGFGLSFEGSPEIGLNYETARFSAGPYIYGNTAYLDLSLFNAGYARADSFGVSTKLIDKSSIGDTVILDKRIIPGLDKGAKTYLRIPYTIGAGGKNRELLVQLDSAKRLHEYFTDNNIFQKSFTVTIDSISKPFVNTYAGNQRLFNGDFASSKDTFRLEIFDTSIEPMFDSTFIISMYLNDNPVFIADTTQVRYTISASNPKFTIRYKPKNDLTNGDYTFTLKAYNGAKTDTINYVVSFNVNNELNLLNVYNYPNPFKDKTTFTFQLSQVPEEFKIRIFTVAGRLIRELLPPPGSLAIGLNKSITWDGRDQDGDAVASGVYLAKLIVKKQGKTITSTQKLAIVR